MVKDCTSVGSKSEKRKKSWSDKHGVNNIVKKLSNSLSVLRQIIKDKDSVARELKIYLSTMEKEEMKF